jgi:hypothetical protein
MQPDYAVVPSSHARSRPDGAASKDWFYHAWTAWFQGLGLSGITTHQTRNTGDVVSQQRRFGRTDPTTAPTPL